jgi:MFS family permease
MSAQTTSSKLGNVIRISSGNFLEMYDFMVYAYYASYIAHEIFPSSNAYASLMMTLGTFGAGYLMRPLGAVVLGAYVDRHGRRAGLIFTLSLMAVGTMVIALTPAYRTIGIVAPIVVLLGRLLQGFSAGVGVGGASIYLAEMATPGHRGFYCAWQSASQQVAVVFAALLGVALSIVMPPERMSAWGWRVPFFIGCMIVPLLFWLRKSLEETEAFLAQKRHPKIDEVLASLVTNWKIVGLGVLFTTMTTDRKSVV